MKEKSVRYRMGNAYDADGASMESALRCPSDENMTKQEFAEECDINTLVRRFNLTGQLPQGVRMPTYGDFSQVSDYHEAMSAIVEAREAFDQMPAEVRLRFANDPGLFVDFCSDPDNRAEAIKLGLVPPDPLPPKSEPKAPSGVTVPAAAPAGPPSTTGAS